jgi:hypothetical protein
MPYVIKNGVGMYVEPNVSNMMKELYLSGIEITKWCHCKMSKLDKQRDIARYERDIKEEESE